jgi:hypothetical protein
VALFASVQTASFEDYSKVTERLLDLGTGHYGLCAMQRCPGSEEEEREDTSQCIPSYKVYLDIRYTAVPIVNELGGRIFGQRWKVYLL